MSLKAKLGLIFTIKKRFFYFEPPKNRFEASDPIDLVDTQSHGGEDVLWLLMLRVIFFTIRKIFFLLR